MPEEVILREKAREAIRSGKLPTRKPDRTFGGPGMGKSCAVCGDTIPPEQMEFEIEFHRQWRVGGTRDIPFPPQMLMLRGVGVRAHQARSPER